MNLSRRTFLGAAAATAASGAPRFSFGVLADVQYADQDTAGKREYRRSIEKFRTASRWFASQRLEFVVQLGDLVDLGIDNLGKMLAEWRKLPAPGRHVVGNHDAKIDRATLLGRLKLERAYYQFATHGWRFVVLDGMDWSVSPGWPEASENRRQGARLLADLLARKQANAQDWNGAIGDAQVEWLRRTLRSATAAHQPAIVFCHFPALPAACRPEHLLWNWREVLDVLEDETSVAAWINGHDHEGGYGFERGIHHLTVPGVVEHDIEAAARVVDVFPDRLVVRRPDGLASQSLTLRGM